MLLMNWAVTFFSTHAFGGRSGPLSRSPNLIDAAGILSGFAAQKKLIDTERCVHTITDTKRTALQAH
jgi:hypothetical protein